jgi:hypothetical protein
MQKKKSLNFGVEWKARNLISVLCDDYFIKSNVTPAIKRNLVALIAVL